VILVIDATVTGPDGATMAGSVAVTVSDPPVPEDQPRPAASLDNLRRRQRAQALRGGISRA
jgi:hypothetical protein